MSNVINKRSFDIKLPFYPHQTIDGKQAPLEIKMDGVDLTHCATDIAIRAGANGFTNVVMGFEAKAGIKAAAHFVANMETTEDEMQLLLGGIFDYVASEYPEGITDGADKTEFVKRIIEETFARIK